MHYKRRNKHHAEYWYDYNNTYKRYMSAEMPNKYLAKSLCDRIAASKNYNRGHFTKDIPYNYFMKEDGILMHEKINEKLIFLLKMYMDEGEKNTFKYIKKICENNQILFYSKRFSGIIKLEKRKFAIKEDGLYGKSICIK